MKKVFLLRLAIIVVVACICIFLLLNFGLNVKASKTYEVLSNNLKDYKIEFEVDYGEGNVGRYTYASADKYYYEYASVINGAMTSIQEVIEESGVKKTTIINKENDKEDKVLENEEPLNKSENYEDIYDNWIQKRLLQISSAKFYKKGTEEINGIKYKYETFETNDENISQIIFYFNNKNELVRIAYDGDFADENIKISSFER